MKKVLYVPSRESDGRRLVYEARGLWSVVTPSGYQTLQGLIDTGNFDFILFDIALSGVWGAGVLSALTSSASCPPLFILSREYSFSFLEYSRDAGACGYFHIPYDFRALRDRIERFFDFRYPAGADSDPLAAELLGRSPSMYRLRAQIAALKNALEPVIIRGETGCGKDLVARLLHRNSPCASGPYRVFNASCLPTGLADSILFGTVRGAFTDSVNTSGLFEQSDGGTLFMDEIGELEPALQPRLLRVLEDKIVTRLGSSEERPVEFRLVCATHRSLEDMVAAGGFRADLFYRIDIIRLEIPPLREHAEDIALLSESYLSRMKKVLSSNAIDKLHGYHWPGNVRQLFGCLARAAVGSDREIIYPEQIRF